jgi:hypothetical protein
MHQLKLFEENDMSREEKDSRYTDNVRPVIYEPTGKCPNVFELVDCSKTKRLISEIEQSNISESEKKFLIEAAHRHSIFNYSKIADYYSNASKEMQELMEKSALVIIDIGKAIELGYVRLSKEIRQIQETTGRWASEEYHNQWRDTRKKQE